MSNSTSLRSSVGAADSTKPDAVMIVLVGISSVGKSVIRALLMIGFFSSSRKTSGYGDSTKKVLFLRTNLA